MPNAATANSATDAYDHRLIAVGFDLLIGAVFAPFGGVNRLRRRALDLADVRSGMRVLELGCGTGGITRLLVERGAQVTAVDGAPRMLAKARLRAPQAEFHPGRVEAFHTERQFDRVLFAFVLHELTASDRRHALAAATQALAPGGAVVILDHGLPASPGLARAWRWLLDRFEPPTVDDCIRQGYDRELVEQGLRVEARHSLAGGTAQLLVCRP
jgi:ubiquinone/menaquinone biosynthesis C-methylase UbiE